MLKVRQLFFSLLAVAAILSTGCTYMHNRGEAAMKMFDIGITVSPICKPGLAVYVSIPGSIGAGGSCVDGKIFGIANNHAGWLDYENKSYGAVLWGSSKQGGGDFDSKDIYQARDDQRDLTERPTFHTGPVRDIACDNEVPSPAFIECDKFVHIGYVGILFNCRFLRIVNFIVGWTTLDFMADADAQAANAGPAKSSTTSMKTSAAPTKSSDASTKSSEAPNKSSDAPAKY
jgi:hypothetical protein